MPMIISMDVQLSRSVKSQLASTMSRRAEEKSRAAVEDAGQHRIQNDSRVTQTKNIPQTRTAAKSKAKATEMPRRHSTDPSTFHMGAIPRLLLCLSVVCSSTSLAAARATSASSSSAPPTAATLSTTTIQTFPVAAPLLGHAAASGALLNSTMALLSARQKLSLETNSIQRHLVEANPLLGGGDAGSGADHSRALKRVFLSNRTVTCNDGSQAGFYLRKNPSSKKWIVFLEGGWHCYDTKSCRARWLKLRHLMTSAQWPETRDVGGILSPLHEENPYWHKANHVLVPYCSSDSWSGTRAAPASPDNNWRFMGSLILRQVVADLIPLGLGRASGAELLLVGSSAGGLGVMLNLDRIRDFLQQERGLAAVAVRGVSDSGWFLDREPYTPAAVASSEAVRQGWKLWAGLLPEQCVRQHPTEPWRCYFGYRLYPTLRAPLFVFQWLFDEAQMRADNVGAPVTPQQWNYIHEMGGALRSSLDNVSAVFAPSCIGHAVLSKRDWVNIRIDEISLPSALRCWEHSTRPRRRRHNNNNNNNNSPNHNKLKRSTEASLLAGSETQQQQQQQRNNQRHQKHRATNQGPKAPGRNRQRATKEQREERQRRRHENQQRRRNRQRQRNNRNKNGNTMNSNKKNSNNNNKNNNNKNKNKNDSDRNPNAAKRSGHKRRRKEQQQQQRDRGLQFQKEQQADQQQRTKKLANNSNSNSNNNNNSPQSPGANRRRPHRTPNVPAKCALRLLERCSWPQCNHSCPSLTNPLTGEEMRFLELLTSFGLDIEAVAAALGVDMHTLNNMDRTELVNLLTQQVS